MKKIETSRAPKPAGHYAQAVVHNGLVFVSGQLPKHPGDGSLEKGPIEDQARLVLSNLAAILEEANSSLGHLLKVNLYIPDISLWERVNGIYGEFMGTHRPARAVIPTGRLHHGALIEVEAVAAVTE